MIEVTEQTSFGTLLRELRLSAGFTQEGLAARSGLSARSISDLERDRTRQPFFRSVELLADALQVPGPVRARLQDAARGARTASPLPSAAAGAGQHGAAEAAGEPVCQLPPVVADFTGRTAEYRRLRGLLVQGQDADVMPVVVVSGPPGMGKSTLALRVAHSLRGSFPDGQLYLQLAGASGRPRDPGEVLGDVLRSLGIASGAIPDGTEQRAALYRSRLADRRVLVLADDTDSGRQITPLLPGTTGCAVLVTSRNRLADLSGARLVPLGPFTGTEAVELLGRIAGADRVAAEPQAAGRLVRGCALLPLAVRIAGAKLAARPGWPLEVVLGRVADERRRLAELAVGELAVRASVAPSYAALDDRARRAFRLLSALGPVDVAQWVFAALLGEPDSADVVNTLADRSLLAAAGVDATGEPRYRLRPLMRDYAAERLAEEPGPARDAPMDRVMAGYLELATLAHRGLPRLGFFPPADPPAGHPAAALPPGAAARLTADPVAWFTAERLNLLAVTGWASARGRYRMAARLASCHMTFQVCQHRVDDAEQMALRMPGLARAGTGRDDQRTTLCEVAATIAEEAHDPALEYETLTTLAYSLLLAEEYQRAEGLCLQGIGMCQRFGRYETGEAFLLGMLGDAYAGQARYTESIDAFRRARAAFEKQGDRWGGALCLLKQGRACLALGRTDEAGRFLRRCLPIFAELGLTAYEEMATQALRACRPATRQTRPAGRRRESPAGLRQEFPVAERIRLSSSFVI